MAKGLLILFIVFAVVGMLHMATLRLVKKPEHKKQKIQKCFGMYMALYSPPVGL